MIWEGWNEICIQGHGCWLCNPPCILIKRYSFFVRNNAHCGNKVKTGLNLAFIRYLQPDRSWRINVEWVLLPCQNFQTACLVSGDVIFLPLFVGFFLPNTLVSSNLRTKRSITSSSSGFSVMLCNASLGSLVNQRKTIIHYFHPKFSGNKHLDSFEDRTSVKQFYMNLIVSFLYNKFIEQTYKKNFLQKERQLAIFKKFLRNAKLT